MRGELQKPEEFPMKVLLLTAIEDGCCVAQAKSVGTDNLIIVVCLA